ncbi:MAG: FHA domain-containing protein [Pyrinomonadaceae bacterium]|nr:FHA domain-containing protein [Pyrinomonadaceae bacterium]
MSEIKPKTKNNNLSPDWLVRGILTKVGDMFDKLTGRGWKPSSSLATSELIEKLKALMDLEVKDLGEKGRFVPHNFKLKMQWDKFSTDSDAALTTLQNELLTAAIDHINDNLYHTFEPFNIEVKPDYFTEGVQILASFDKLGNEENEVAVKVTVPGMKVNQLTEPEQPQQLRIEKYRASFLLNGVEKVINLELKPGQRLSVGRGNENNLTIEDASVSKIHASLMLNNDNQLVVADTGSTNGTFINNERIPYGKAIPIEKNQKVIFGLIEVSLNYIQPSVPELIETEKAKPVSVSINGFEFKSKSNLNEEIPKPEKIQNDPEPKINETEQRISFDFDDKDTEK